MAPFRLGIKRIFALCAITSIGIISLMPDIAVACEGGGGGSSGDVKIVKPTTPFDFGKVKVGEPDEPTYSGTTPSGLGHYVAATEFVQTIKGLAELPADLQQVGFLRSDCRHDRQADQ
jgi:hypothetical protein